ncbi:glutamyl-tRNA reductase [Oerskovia enterophila]|uniref:Glutamyl-tRNA reductase n=2 Tax=Oerskovia enterophila TaxID=43678 RepID=A0A163SX42_9CELL|nr:glutamyl-tRNA reductase [Oerskovia enterophila]KZM36850.1 glutamyl-tRNA reductase [Oerskovia enterophila]OCI29483.1 glutamyl-tRNA reductase [Oerskovia enterophila]
MSTLELLSTGAASVGRTAVETCEAITGAVVVATCNRFEVYLDVDSPVDGRGVQHASHEVARLVAAASGVAEDVAVGAFSTRTGPDVAAHLFEVAAGLDSMVVGEREIAGQVKRALEEAREGGATSSTLELLFQTASRTSKRISNETTLGGNGRSVVSLGLDLASAELPPWRQVRTVLIGTGSYAGASLAALRARGCEDVRVYSGSGRAEQFAADRGAVAVTDLVAALEDADLVVSCSGARGRVVADVGGGEAGRVGGGGGAGAGAGAPRVTGLGAEGDAVRAEGDALGAEGDAVRAEGDALGHVLDAAALVRARSRAAEAAGDEAPHRPMVVLDLALHRDVDPRVADVDGVLLYDLASLKAHSPALGSLVVGQARRIVDRATRDFEETRLGRAADTAVMELLDDADRRIAAEVAERVAERRAAGTEVDDAETEALTRSVRRRVHADLHDAIVAARSSALATAQAEASAVVADAEEALRSAGTNGLDVEACAGR